MDIVTLLIINAIVIGFCTALIILLAVAWLKAEYKICLLGGETKWFKTAARRKGK